MRSIVSASVKNCWIATYDGNKSVIWMINDYERKDKKNRVKDRKNEAKKYDIKFQSRVAYSV